MHILHVSDFFFPNVGGVETHIYLLCQCLLQRGHKVVVLTHSYGGRVGVRWMTNGLKVYYISRLPVYQQVTLPTVFPSFPLLRCILLREQIELVHCHQQHCMRAHGLQGGLTDHSLPALQCGEHTRQQMLEVYSRRCPSGDMCVPYQQRKHSASGPACHRHRVSVIPNAVEAAAYTPSLEARDPSWVTILCLSRLVYRKGIDLLVHLLPVVCRRHPRVRFLIGGDGPKAGMLRDMVAREGLRDRIVLLGQVAREDVPHVS
eukprot:jgi/Botrbrau1/12814/Bobra.20_1s0005.1